MLKRQAGYMVLIGFAVVMVVLLMLDDPGTRQTLIQNFSATQSALNQNRLFPELTQLTQVTGIDMLDVTTGKGILVMRNEQGLWYAPEIPDIQTAIPASNIDQYVVEGATTAVLLLQAEQTFAATPENLTIFGLDPQPTYRARFRVLDQAGRAYEAAIEIGNKNPDNVAYYVYVLTGEDQRVFLISGQIVDLLLTMLTEPLELTPTSDVSPMDSEVATPVP